MGSSAKPTSEQIERTKIMLLRMPQWWNRITSDDDIPSLGTISRYGIHIGGKGQMFKQTEEIAVRLAGLSDGALEMSRWIEIVKEELNRLNNPKGKSAAKAQQDRIACSILYFKAALGYNTKRIADSSFRIVTITERRIRELYASTVERLASTAIEKGLLSKKNEAGE